VLGDFRTSEQRIPASAMLGRALEVNMTINNSWGYSARDTHWKSPRQLIRNLSDIASKDGNYLLDVGPTAEGVIPQPEADRLLAMGRWLQVNGEAIYATRGGPYPQPLAWGRTTQRNWPATAQRFSCTSGTGPLMVKFCCPASPKRRAPVGCWRAARRSLPA
jgi:alpha-L-fucosidase